MGKLEEAMASADRTLGHEKVLADEIIRLRAELEKTGEAYARIDEDLAQCRKEYSMLAESRFRIRERP